MAKPVNEQVSGLEEAGELSIFSLDPRRDKAFWCEVGLTSACLLRYLDERPFPRMREDTLPTDVFLFSAMCVTGAAAVVGPHPLGDGSSKMKKEQTAGKRDLR